VIEVPPAPSRGFPRSEFTDRFVRAQEQLAAAGLDALLVTLPEQIRYFTGFHTELWTSPTRPWYVVLPAEGDKPIAVIPDAGASGMAMTWVEDIRSWPAPRPDDDGVTLLADALRASAGRSGRVGAELGRELHMRMPYLELERVRALSGVELSDGTEVIRRCRRVKSDLEVDKIRYACHLASASYAMVPTLYAPGDSERSLAQKFRLDVITRGADGSPFLVASSGPAGYSTITMGPTDRVLQRGDVVIIDTGTTYDGYFCDFDRNWSIGYAADEVKRAYEAAWLATEAGLAAATPGATCAQLWLAMDSILRSMGSLGNNAGRIGHGLGLQLTEPPSLTGDDDTVLDVGTVITIEPGMEFAPGRMMVHEEVIVIREGGAELLTIRAPQELPVIS
jgi:Xaa-Pro dipeptidase